MKFVNIAEAGKATKDAYITNIAIHECDKDDAVDALGHGLVGDELQAGALCVGDSSPANAFAVTHALGLGEVDELLLDGALVEAYEGAGLAVGVVVQGTATIVLVLVITGGHLQGIAQTGQGDAGIAADDAAV